MTFTGNALSDDSPTNGGTSADESFHDDSPAHFARKMKRSDVLASVFLAASNIHTILTFGALLIGASAVFLALPRDDVAQLGNARIGLELFLLVLTLLGAAILYRPFRPISHTLMLTTNLILVTTVAAASIQYDIEGSIAAASAGLVAFSIVLLFEAWLYRSKVFGALASLCLMAVSLLILPVHSKMSGTIITAAIILAFVHWGSRYLPDGENYFPRTFVLGLVEISVPLALVVGFIVPFYQGPTQALDFSVSAAPPITALLIWVLAGGFYLLKAEVRDSRTDAVAGTILIAAGALLLEIYVEHVTGVAAWTAGSLFALVGGIDIHLRDNAPTEARQNRLVNYGPPSTYAGFALTLTGLAISFLPRLIDHISLTGLTLFEGMSHVAYVTVMNPPTLIFALGSALIYAVATWFSRRSVDLTGALIGGSLLYIAVQGVITPHMDAATVTHYLGWMVFPLSAALAVIGLYGYTTYSRRDIVIPYLVFGTLWAIISTALALIELQDLRGALLFALYAGIAGLLSYQTGWRPMTWAFSVYLTLTFVYLLLPAGVAPEQIAILLPVLAFVFYLLSLLLYFSDDTHWIGHIIQNVGLSMMVLAGIFALSRVKLSPETFTLVLWLSALLAAIELFQAERFDLGYNAILISAGVFWLMITLADLPFEKVQFYSMSAGIYGIATYVYLRNTKNLDAAVMVAGGSLCVILGTTLYQLFIDPGSPSYFGLLVIQVSALFFASFFLRSRWFLYGPMSVLTGAMAVQLLRVLWDAGSGGLVSIILIMIVIGVPVLMFAITLAVARDSLLRAGRMINEQLEEWGF